MKQDKDSRLSPAENNWRNTTLVAPPVYTLSTALRRAFSLSAKRTTGLSQEGWRVMILVGAHQPLSLNALAEISGLDRGQLSRAATQLVTQGLLWRERQGRTMLHRLTAEGEAVCAILNRNAAARNEVLLSGVSEERRREFFSMLELLIVRAQELHETEKALHGKGATPKGD